MIINIPQFFRKVFILLTTVLLFGGNENSPVFSHIPELFAAVIIILAVLYFLDRDVVRITHNGWMLFGFVLIALYLVLEFYFWALYPGTVKIYITRYLLLFILMIFNINCESIVEIMTACKWYAAAIGVVYVGMYALQGNNGSFLGSYQNVACGMCIAMLIAEINIFLSKEKDKIDIALFIFYLMVLMMTGKRTFLIIPFVLMLVFVNVNNLVVAVKENRKRIVRLVLLLVILAVIVLAVKPDLLSSINRIADNGDDAMSGRDRLWGLAIYLWQNNPIKGIGMGGYVNFIRYNNAFTKSLMGVSLITSVHNIYLQLLAENGVIGFGLYMIFFISNLVFAIKNLRRAISIQKIKVTYAAYFALFLQIWFLIYGVTGNPLFTLYQIFIYFFAVMVSQSVKYEIEEINNHEIVNNNTGL